VAIGTQDSIFERVFNKTDRKPKPDSLWSRLATTPMMMKFMLFGSRPPGWLQDVSSCYTKSNHSSEVNAKRRH